VGQSAGVAATAPGAALVLGDPDDARVDALVAGVLDGSVATGVGRREPPDVQDTVTRTATINAGAARI